MKESQRSMSKLEATEKGEEEIKLCNRGWNASKDKELTKK